MKAFMPLFLLAVSAMVAPSAQAFFPVQVQSWFTPQQVNFAIENIYAAPIVCQGRFMARTALMPEGIWLNFAIGPVVAGTEGYATMVSPYVYQGDYFIEIPVTQAYCDFY